MQCHVLGSILAPAIVAPWILDVRRRAGRERRVLASPALAGLAAARSYVPLLIHELDRLRGARAAVAFATGGGEPSSMSLPIRFLVIGLRVARLAARRPDHGGPARRDRRRGRGHRRDRLALAMPATRRASRVALVRADAALDDRRPVGRRERPRDGRGAPPERPLPRLRRPDRVRRRRARHRRASGARLPDGRGRRGAAVDARARRWPARSSSRSSASTSSASRRWSRPTAAGRPATRPRSACCAASRPAKRRSRWSLTSLPDFKSADALRFPLVRRGADVPDRGGRTRWASELLPHVVLCDALFEEAIGAACGGPAEDALSAHTPSASSTASRPRRTAGCRSTSRR